MQIIRGIIVIIGSAVMLLGAYLVFIGAGAPIEISGLEIGPLKGDIRGITAGAVVAAIGGAMVWLAAQYLKKTTEKTTEYAPTKISDTKPASSGGGGGGGLHDGDSGIARITKKELQAPKN